MKKNKQKNPLTKEEKKMILYDFIGLVVYAFIFAYGMTTFKGVENGFWINLGISAAFLALWYYFVDRKTGGVLYTGIILVMIAMFFYRNVGF